MKRVLCLLLLTVILTSFVPIDAKAAEQEIIYFEDGSYAMVHVLSYSTRAGGSISGNKTYTYYNSSDVMQWKAVLTGTFTYTGSSASCTSSAIDVTIYCSDVYLISKNAGKSENIARGSATVGKKLLGVTISRYPVSLTLTCDANGNLS